MEGRAPNVAYPSTALLWVEYSSTARRVASNSVEQGTSVHLCTRPATTRQHGHLLERPSSE
eukprot:8664038-Alexandrium_andersonii.AAC.1